MCFLGGSWIFAASEASIDTIFDDSRTTRAPADGKNPVPADIVGSQAMDGYPSAISAHSKMAVVVCNTVIFFCSFSLLGRRKTTLILIVSRIFQNHSNNSNNFTFVRNSYLIFYLSVRLRAFLDISV